MATFIALTRDPGGEAIYINMDRIISLERIAGSKGQCTTLTPETKDRAGITVTETPDEIITLIRDEQRT
jgi:hypothetical protein